MRWRDAMQEALYGEAGFFVRNRPADHFRTSAHSPLFGVALARLLVHLDQAMDQPDRLDVVDVGAGQGELMDHLLAALPEAVRDRVNPVAVELTERQPALFTWRQDIPDGINGLVLATEWLDNVPLDLAQDGRYLLAEGGAGPVLDPEDAGWVERYWPGGELIEIGRSRDDAWAGAVSHLRRGLAVAVDYGHVAGERPAHSTVTGFRAGREVPLEFDGSTDITCHVAMDSAGAAGSRVAGGAPYQLLRQREALRALGISGARPPLSLASSDPTGYVRALATAGEAAELTDPHGLGGHWWLLQPVGVQIEIDVASQQA